ncbi:HAD family hydrolase [Scytonema sp. NUACC26]|uniref:HAD family hydrolase n=1 Tax=Scytonema sp. NUACC26 TaxID=3140176 RepID=UPI0034DBC7D5
MIKNFEEELTYQYRDRYRLENIQENLDLVKNGTPDSRIKALETIERILLRIHDTYAIAWDFGGVLMDGHNKLFIELYARSKGVDLSREKLTQLWQIIFKSAPIPGENYDALKIGQATPEEFASHAIAHFNTAFTTVGKDKIEITNSEIRNFLTLYYSHYDPKHENGEILQSLKQLGIRQYGLTNNFMAKIEYFLSQQEFDYLQGVIPIVSEKFGVSKPSPQIYLLFKQHVFIDRFAKEILQVDLPDSAISQLWQAVFQIDAKFYSFVETQHTNLELSQSAILACDRILKELGYANIDVTLVAERWLDFWTNNYEQIGEQTIFVDDKVKNLNQAFKCEGILGVHYDANKGQTLAAQPVLRELLKQEQLKQVIRILRELTVVDNSLGRRASLALKKLMPFRIRHEKLNWLSRVKKHHSIVDAVSDEQIYALLEQHYEQLYTAYFQLGQLVSYQYALIHRIVASPEYTYDEARQIVLQLFEASNLFLDRNRDLSPDRETTISGDIASNLDDVPDTESILKKKLLPEIKRKIVEYIDVLDVSHQPIIRALMKLLQTQIDDLPTLKQFMEQLLQQLTVLKSIRLVSWQHIEQLFKNLREMLNLGLEPSSRQLDEWYQQLEEDAQQTPMDLVPLQQMIAEWEQEIHQLESTYFQQYYQWNTLNDRVKIALYQDAILDGVREQFLPENLYQFIQSLMLRVYDLPRWKDLTKPTIILVSGSSGSGKSTLSTQVARLFGIQKVFSTDEAGRANTKAILDFLFGQEEAAEAFPALYQSSFEGNIQSYYCQSILSTIGVEGLVKRLHKQNTSALIEGVGLLPGLISEPIFELLNIDWLIMQVDPQQHWQHFALRSRSATQRDADRYRANFDMIRTIHDQIVMMGRAHGLTIVENTEPIQQMIDMAIERIKGPNSDQFFEVNDSIRDEMNELLATQRQHLPVKIHFDVKRAAMNLGIEEDTITTLLYRFGFQAAPSRRHQWIRQPSRDVQLIQELPSSS